MKHQLTYPFRQAGVVLFIALVALVVMSLAAAALIRSVDSNTIIAGNLAFKQSAVTATDRGVEAAFNWLNTTADDSFLNDNADAGYLATIPDLRATLNSDDLNLDDPAVLRNDDTWDDSVTIAAADPDDGNVVSYIIQRMCLNDGEAIAEPIHCIFGQVGSPVNEGGRDDGRRGMGFAGGGSPIYRVTVRVTGPKNTVSYSQAYAY